MNLADLVVVGLATARLYQLFAHDTILDKPRWWVDRRYPKVGDWLSCPWCAGFWLTLVVFGVWFTPLYWLVWVGAAAETASLAGLVGNRLTADPPDPEPEPGWGKFEGNGE